jgi:hypothetical protein
VVLDGPAPRGVVQDAQAAQLGGQVKEIVGDRQAFVGIEGEVAVLVVLVGGRLAAAGLEAEVAGGGRGGVLHGEQAVFSGVISHRQAGELIFKE